jgi:hypothetical protein
MNLAGAEGGLSKSIFSLVDSVIICSYVAAVKDRDSSGTLVTRLRTGYPGLIPRTGEGSSLCHSFHTASGAHPAPCPMGIRRKAAGS